MGAYPSFVEYPLFTLLMPYFEVDTPTGPGPYNRIELKPMAQGLEQEVLRFEKPCVRCGNMTHPFRRRRGKSRGGSMYFAAACEQAKSRACSRSTEAHDEVKRVADAVLNGPPPPTRQLGLF